jgi:hypothetical protein
MISCGWHEWTLLRYLRPEETLTVHRLHVPPQLRKTLASTNVIESAFSIVERVCRNVKRWHAGDQRERWVNSHASRYLGSRDRQA